MLKYGEETKNQKANEQNKILKKAEELIKNKKMYDANNLLEKHKNNPELYNLIKNKLSKKLSKVA